MTNARDEYAKGFSTQNKLHSDIAFECDALKLKLSEESAIVDRVWKALGITTYEQAKPFAIDEHVTKLKLKLEVAKVALESLASYLFSDEVHPLAARLRKEAKEALSQLNESGVEESTTKRPLRPMEPRWDCAVCGECQIPAYRDTCPGCLTNKPGESEEKK